MNPFKMETTSKTTDGGKDKAGGDKEKGREEREEVYLEEEIKIQEEDLYEEVTCWIEESQEISMESPKKETKTRELENRGDIRNLLGICQKSKEEERKDKIEERGEDDLICTPRRKVVHIAESKGKKEMDH